MQKPHWSAHRLIQSLTNILIIGMLLTACNLPAKNYQSPAVEKQGISGQAIELVVIDETPSANGDTGAATATPQLLPPIPNPTWGVTPTPVPPPPLPTPAGLPSPTLSPVTLVTFTASPVHGFAVGDTITITWEVAGVSNVAICVLDLQGTLQTCRMDLPPAGELALVVEGQEWGRINLYYNELTSWIDLTPPCENDWFFEDAPDACSLPQTRTTAIGQYFEHGLAIFRWIEGVRWGRFLLEGGEQRFASNFGDRTGVWPGTPPEGLYHPAEEFAAVWLGEHPGSEDVGSRLGWATMPPIEYEMVIQCEKRNPRCYMLGPGQEVIAIDNPPGGPWHFWEGS